MPAMIDTWNNVDREVLRAATSQLALLTFGGRCRMSNLDPHVTRLACGIHGIAPFFGTQVRSGTVSFGDELDAWFVGQSEHNRRRLTLMRDELYVTLDAFKRAGIEIIPLKGSAMILDDLDTIAWRPMADLDVLVSDPDKRQVDLAFAHAGYCLHGQSWKHRQYGPCDAGDRPLFTDSEHPGNPRNIESHPAVAEMFRGFRWDITPWIMNNLHQVDGVSIPTDRAMSLHLAVHLSVSILEATTRMIHILDFARVVDQAGGVSGIRQAVEKSGIEQHARFIYPAVALAAQWTAHSHLQAYEKELRPHVSPALPPWLARVDFHDISWAGREDRGVLDRVGLWARSPAERLRMLSSTILPSPALLASAGYSGSGPLAAISWYPKHYRHLMRRILG
ncbi:hypothetical protein BH24CHL1_BH24CHL1_03940 [soil metagenome]